MTNKHGNTGTLLIGALFFGLFSTDVLSDEAATDEFTVHKYDWLTNGVKSGSFTLSINQNDGTRKGDFEFNDRGRGPNIHEVVRYSQSGQVSSIEISGHSYMGAPIDERFELKQGVASWQSTLEQGSSNRVEAFYVANDGTPEQLASLARKLLASETSSLDLLPNGTASIQQLDKIQHTVAATTLTFSLYAINGLGTDPQFIWLNENNELFGLAIGWVGMVPEGWTHIMSKLQERQDQAELTFFQHRSAPLTHILIDDYVINNVSVIDVDKGMLVENQAVFVSGGIIQSISRALEETAGLTVIDGRGGSLVPGLWDMHSHISIEQGILHVAAGVTTIRDMGNNPEQYRSVRDRFDSGEVIGPRAYAAGFIDKKSPFSAPIKTLAETKEGALDLVRKYAGLGYPQIKIYSSIEPDWVKAIAEETHALGMRLSGHIPSFMTAEQAVREGFNEIQHLNMLFLNFLAGPEDDTRTPLRFSLVAEKGGSLDLDSAEVNAFLELLKTNDVVIDPTVAIFDNMFRHRSGELSPSFAMVADHFPPTMKRGMLAGRMDINPENSARYAASADALLVLIKKLFDAKIQIVAGTDSLAGFGLHRELELYQKAGIPAPDVLRLATLGAAELMGAAATSGSIAPGKQADFALLTENPLEDISALRNIQMVFKGDRYFKPAQMYQAVGIEPFN